MLNIFRFFAPAALLAVATWSTGMCQEPNGWPQGYENAPTERIILRDGRKFIGRLNEGHTGLAMVIPVRAVLELQPGDVVKHESVDAIEVQAQRIPKTVTTQREPPPSDESPLLGKMRDDLRLAQTKEASIQQSLEEGKIRIRSLEEHLANLQAEYEKARARYEVEGGARLGIENTATYRLRNMYLIVGKGKKNIEEAQAAQDVLLQKQLEVMREIQELEEDLRSLEAAQKTPAEPASLLEK